MTISAFPDRQPTPDELAEKLGSTFKIWEAIKKHINEDYPVVTEEWFTSGKKYGWSFRMISKKRRIDKIFKSKKVFFKIFAHFFFVVMGG